MNYRRRVTPRRSPAPRVGAQRGAAMVEAVIMLPFFILIYFGIHYWGAQEIARTLAKQHARSCAWTYSNDACKDTARVQKVCGDRGRLHFGRPTDSGGAPDLEKSASDRVNQKTGGANLPSSGRSGKIGDFAGKWLDEALEALLGKKRTRTASIDVRAPSLFAQKSTQVSGSYRLTCNQEPKTIRQLFNELWKKISPF